MKDEVKKNRLMSLYALMAGLPSRVIDMDGWRSTEDGHDPSNDELELAVSAVKATKTACGTTACALGFACSAPEFIKEGLVWEKDRWDQYHPTFDGYFNFEAAEEFFGISIDRSEKLFGSIDDHETGTHKQIFLRRLRKYLVKKGYITPVESLRLRWQEAIQDEAEGVEVR